MKIIITDNGKEIGISVTDCGETKPTIKELIGTLEIASFLLLSRNGLLEVKE